VFDMTALVLLNRRLQVVPAHTPHLVERVGLLTIIMLGESAISISAPDSPRWRHMPRGESVRQAGLFWDSGRLGAVVQRREISQSLTAVREAAVPDHSISPGDHIEPTGRIREDVTGGPSRLERRTPMRHALATLMIGAVVVAGYIPGADAAQQSSQTGTKGTKSTKGTAEAAVPPPVAVKVIAVDPAAKTITVRDIAAVAATPDTKAIEVKLPVTENATGQKLGDTKVGETVAVTCEVKPAVDSKAGAPIVLTDCVKVIKIEPKS
jgi:hypothetical protein